MRSISPYLREDCAPEFPLDAPEEFLTLRFSDNRCEDMVEFLDEPEFTRSEFRGEVVELLVERDSFSVCARCEVVFSLLVLVVGLDVSER